MSSRPAPPAPTVTPDALADAQVLAESNQGVVYRVTLNDRDYAIKAATGRGIVGAANRLALKREHHAYRHLDGAAGIPRCHGLAGGRWLVLDYVPARPFREASVEPVFFDRLLAVIRDMHERGVAHGDLKRKANLLVDEAGDPLVLDFGAAVVRRPGFHPANRRLFEFMRRTDLNAWVKLKYGGYEGVPDADRALLDRSLLERMLGRIRR
ncbi:MAG: hypothetical protein ACNS61_17085 [Candidatus Wenzhouxiangella sp. M2_3B_020]